MVTYDCWSIPGNGPFDRALAKVGLDRRQLRNVFFEFLGTLLFAFFGGFSSPASAGAGAWVNGLILASLVYATDGAHLNPAVTISALLTRNIKPLLALLYIIAQVGGAIVGVVIQIGLLPTTENQPGCFTPNGITKGQMFGMELLGTLLFVLVVQGVALRFDSFLNVYVDLNADQYGNTGPLAIGLTITGLAFSIGGYTGAAINPARAIAPAIIYRCTNAWTTVVYVLAELAGAILASGIAFVAYGIKKPAVKMLNQPVEETPLIAETRTRPSSLGQREAHNISRRSALPVASQV